MGLFDKIFKKEAEKPKEDLPKIKPKNLKDETMNKFIKDAKMPVLVDCWADWCVPCKQLAPSIAELAAEYNGKIYVTKLNTEKNRKMSQKYSIKSIPTILYFKNGKLVTRTVGALPKKSVKKVIEDKLLK